MLIFWTFAFPIILGTFFNLAFSNIENSEKLDIIDIAIVNNEEFEDNEILKQTFKELSNPESEEQLFNITYTSLEESKNLLEQKEITGYLILNENKPKVVVTDSGINETIFKSVIEEITQTTDMISNLSQKEIAEEIAKGNHAINYENIYKKVLEIVQNQETYISNVSNSNLSYTMIEFYTLIAMACLYGGILGLVAINQNLPNMSDKGKRVAVAPINKSKIIFSSVLASYITQLIGLALLFAFTILVLKVDYGSNLPLIVLLACLGAFAGLAIGLGVGTLVKSNENTKTGIIISITMFGCFLSGMMGITMKYIVDKNMPIINKINPASMITDGFYSLYYYDTLDRYWFNIISLLIFAFIMISISYMSLRRQKYDSI